MQTSKVARFVGWHAAGVATQLAGLLAEKGIDLVTVGRFDRMNLLLSSESSNFYVYDNVRRAIVESGEFPHVPLDSQGSSDGTKAYVAFRDSPQIAIVDLERHDIEYITAGSTGIGAFNIGLSNNVCH